MSCVLFIVGRMRINVLENKASIANLDPKDRHIHLLFSPTEIEISRLIQACPALETIIAPSNVYRFIPQTTKVRLKMHGVFLIEGDIDIQCDSDGRCTIDYEILDEIRSLRRSGFGSDLIIQRAEEHLHMPPDLTQYLLRAY